MIDHLSPSSIRMYLRCPEQWRRRYVLGEKIPPAGAQHLGRSFHAAAEANHAQKVGTYADLPRDELEDRYSDEFESIPRSEVVWEGESPNRVKDDGSKLIGIYADRVAPGIQPTHAEQRVIVPIECEEEVPPLLTVIDVIDQNGIADLKTSSKFPTQDAAHDSDQLTAYALAHKAAFGEIPRVRLEFFIRPSTKFFLGRHESRMSLRSRGQLDTYLTNVRAVAAQIGWSLRTGFFPYADPESWWCSERACGYYDTCPGGRARRTAISFVSGLGEPLPSGVKEATT